jgi:putative hemolysin
MYMQQENKEIHITPDFLDLEKVIGSKSPRLLKMMPRPLISYLKRVIHQQELNSHIWENRNVFGSDFATNILASFGAIVTSAGISNVPREGRQLLVSNHPLGGLDGMALMSEVGKIRRDILFPVNDLLLYLPNLRELFIPVNKHGSNAENIRIFNEAFASGNLILYFPAGLVSRKNKGIIKDLEWKKTFLTKAQKFQRDIIPVHISGRNTNFFYNLANWRKRLKIKANIEMLYLVDEMYKQKDQTVHITFGQPVPIGFFDKQHTAAQWAQLLREYVYALGAGTKENFIEWHKSNQT